MTDAYDLVDRVREALAAQPGVREVRMFGGLSFMVEDKMVVSVRGNGDLLVRADPVRADELLAVEGARPAEMGAGRPMSLGWISVGEQGIATDEGVDFWLGVALEYRHGGSDTTRSRGRRRDTPPGQEPPD